MSVSLNNITKTFATARGAVRAVQQLTLAIEQEVAMTKRTT